MPRSEQKSETERLNTGESGSVTLDRVSRSLDRRRGSGRAPLGSGSRPKAEPQLLLLAASAAEGEASVC